MSEVVADVAKTAEAVTPTALFALPTVMRLVPHAIVAGLLGLSWAAARADDVAGIVAPTMQSMPSLPTGLDGITLPTAFVLIAYLFRGWAPSITITVKHVHSLDDDTRKTAKTVARIAAGTRDATDHGEE